MWQYVRQKKLLKGVVVLGVCMAPCVVGAAPNGTASIVSHELPAEIHEPQRDSVLVENPLQLGFASVLSTGASQETLAFVPAKGVAAVDVATLDDVKTIEKPDVSYVSFDFSKLHSLLERAPQNVDIIQEKSKIPETVPSSSLQTAALPQSSEPLEPVSLALKDDTLLDSMLEAMEGEALPSPEMQAQADFPDKLDLPLGLEESKLAVGMSSDFQNSQDFFGAAGSSLSLSLEGRKGFVADIMHPVSLAAAVALALQNNYEVRAAMHGTNSAFWDKMGAYSQYLPTVEYNAARGIERSRPGSYNDLDGNRVLDTKHFRMDNSFSVRQPLFDPSIVADIMKFHSSENMMEEQETGIKEDIALKTVSSFLSLLHTRKTVQLIDRYQGYLKRLQERMEMRLQGGAAIRADLDRINSRIMVVKSQRSEAAGQYRNALGEFKRLTRVMPSQLQIPQSLIPLTPETEDEAIESALLHNPIYKTNLTKIEIARGDRNRSFAGLFPKLSLEYSREKTYNAGGVADGNPIDGVYPKQDDERLMLVASWKLTGGTSLTSGASGHEKIRQMTFLADDTRERIKTAIEIGYDALRSSKDRVSALQEAYLVDMRIVNDFEEQYKHGSRSLFELLDAYERMHKSQLTLMSTIIARAEAAYGIRQQMGELADSIVKSEKT